MGTARKRSQEVDTTRRNPKRQFGVFRWANHKSSYPNCYVVTDLTAQVCAEAATPYPNTSILCMFACFRYQVPHPVEPSSLLGRRVCVKWDDADAWYNGTVTGYEEGTCKHQVSMPAPHHRGAMHISTAGSLALPCSAGALL